MWLKCSCIMFKFTYKDYFESRLKLKDITKLYASSLETVLKAFTAAALCCCLFVCFCVPSFVLINWKSTPQSFDQVTNLSTFLIPSFWYKELFNNSETLLDDFLPNRKSFRDSLVGELPTMQWAAKRIWVNQHDMYPCSHSKCTRSHLNLHPTGSLVC